MTSLWDQFSSQVASEYSPTLSEPRTEYEEVEKKSDKLLWDEIMQEYRSRREEIEEYIRSKKSEPDPPKHPVVEYLEATVFPTLNAALIDMIETYVQQECFATEAEFFFNGLDHIAEYLWNTNPNHTERRTCWTSLSLLELLWGFAK